MHDITPHRRSSPQPRPRARSIERHVVHERRVTPAPRVIHEVIKKPVTVTVPTPVQPPAAPVVAKPVVAKPVLMHDVVKKQPVHLGATHASQLSTPAPLLPQTEHRSPRKTVTPHPPQKPAVTTDQLAAMNDEKKTLVQPIVHPVHIPEITKKHSKSKKQKKSRRSWWLYALAVVFILVTGYVAIDTWLTNRSVGSDSGAAVEGASTQTAQASEGTDERPIAQANLSNYQVANEFPRLLSIDKLKIKSRVLPMGVNLDGTIQTPKNIYDTGWYTSSTKPGEIGATFIDGHASGPTREGVFAYLDTLNVGDELSLEKGDHSILKYRVVHTETIPLDEIDMKKVLLPYGNTLKALNLMTCTGTWVNEKATYDKRVIVYTELVE